jgi:hypothetical protein
MSPHWRAWLWLHCLWLSARFGWPDPGTEANFPFCTRCGRHNLIYFTNGQVAFAPDYLHALDCYRPRERRIRDRFVRRYGKRAARRHLSW